MNCDDWPYQVGDKVFFFRPEHSLEYFEVTIREIYQSQACHRHYVIDCADFAEPIFFVQEQELCADLSIVQAASDSVKTIVKNQKREFLLAEKSRIEALLAQLDE